MPAMQLKLPMVVALAVLGVGCSGLYPLERTPQNLTGQNITHSAPYRLLWSKDLSPDAAVMKAVGTERAVAAFSANGKVVYAGTRHNGMYAIDSDTGANVWRRAVKGGVIGQPAVGEKHIVVGTGEGRLEALGISDGRQIWSNALKGLAVRQPILRGQAVIARDGTNTLYAFSMSDGKWLWQQARARPTKFSMAGEGPLFAASGQLYVGYSDGTVACYSIHGEGKELWRVDLGGQSSRFHDADGGFAFVQQYLAVASPATGIALIDTRNGKISSRIPRPNLVTVKNVDAHLVGTTTDGAVVRIDPSRNTTIWRRSFSRDDGAPNDVAVQGELIFVTFPRGGMVALDAKTGGPQFGLDVGRGFTGIAVHPETRRIAILTTRGQLLMLGSQSHSATMPASPTSALNGTLR